MQGISREGTLRLAPHAGSQHSDCSFLGLRQWPRARASGARWGTGYSWGDQAWGRSGGARLRMPPLPSGSSLGGLVTNEHPGVGSRNTQARGQ